MLAVEVDYTPGAASPSHTYAKSAFIYAYVILGAIESKVNDGETRIYRAGESWSEPPGAIHSISRNASKTEPAKLLAVFVLDTNDNPLTTTIKQIFRRIERNEGPQGGNNGQEHHQRDNAFA